MNRQRTKCEFIWIASRSMHVLKMRWEAVKNVVVALTAVQTKTMTSSSSSSSAWSLRGPKPYPAVCRFNSGKSLFANIIHPFLSNAKLIETESIWFRNKLFQLDVVACMRRQHAHRIMCGCAYMSHHNNRFHIRIEPKDNDSGCKRIVYTHAAPSHFSTCVFAHRIWISLRKSIRRSTHGWTIECVYDMHVTDRNRNVTINL